MKKKQFLSVIITASLFFAGKASVAEQIFCNSKCGQHSYACMKDSLTVYKSGNLVILKLSEQVYQHISFLQTNDFGKVSCNGMIVVNAGEAIVFDSPVNNESAVELINFLIKKRGYNIKAVIPTHFHEDCVGGLEAFNERGVPAYASNTTLLLLKNKGRQFSRSIHGFDDSLTLTVGDKKVYAKYFGEGHTKDNIVGYFPAAHTVFGGCLIKETGAGKGFLDDANINAWPQTVDKLKKAWPNISTVIPGHGNSGGIELLDYTIELFK